jgi:2-oxoglutarate dehydrogenase E1 component
MTSWNEFHGPNAAYILDLYDRFRQDPGAVDAATRAFFEGWTPPPDGAAAFPTAAVTTPSPDFDKIMGAVNLAQAIREYGHLAAQLDPLAGQPPGDPDLDPAAHNLTEDDLRQLPATLIGGPPAEQAANALEAIQALRDVYTATTGYDYDHIRVPAEREWLRQAAESGHFRPPQSPIDPKALLERLTQVETFEHFLHRIFPGKTRFSIEGLDIMVPVLDEVIAEAAGQEITNIILGMAHRGRLNVLAHVLHKPYNQILAEFKDPIEGRNLAMHSDMGWTGDVKYHAGSNRALRDGDVVDLVISMAPNPSHLEHVNPVVLGMDRAAGTEVSQPGPPQFDHGRSIPILIHGDAAFPGQGVVAETLNFYRVPGYTTGGAIHIIANNQVGFTTNTDSARSTLYASDLAKGFKIPIVHVNADDPVACLEAARLAFAYCQQFQKDFVIDLIGYRRYGHNEGDEPGFTQPLMYQKIDNHPTVRRLWADELVKQGLITPERPEELVQQQMETLQAVLESLQPSRDVLEPQLEPPPPGAARRVKTAVPARRLRQLHESLLELPADFHLNPKLERARQRRRAALDKADERTIEWAAAEELALASILADGIAIRFTGEDVERGTFSQRHAVFHDVESGRTYTPLQAIPQAQAAFEIHNSPLSENAAIAYEYGYNIQAPERLVLWEAQYGDFINTAQAMVDEFLVSGRAKWEQTPSLVLLLPHGYEGQGPDHSSARLERFLQLAAETNMRVAYPTTAAQYFHLLRRQALLLRTDPLPLIVMTPKSLLRHRLAASSLEEIANGSWQRVIGDEQAEPEAVRRLVLCSGKVYVDLISSERRANSPAVATARVEQLYPFPAEDLRPVLEAYPNLTEVVWLQEEPANMGAWESVRPCLQEMIGGRWPLRYVGRPRRASPAEGSSAWHTVNQAAIVKQAYDGLETEKVPLSEDKKTVQVNKYEVQ